ncbi:NmrA family NAD(P)-binding protein [Streptomyces acidiscabies]|uniref:NmrA family NAD(P)-binding protein n=1 Tax=Streptomyces acidiscabies TaxID=42234 RepID=UPI00073E685F|nr:NmrA family NAD(P)-binding protein [Streptomyces acidiscabies]GAQ53263.1 NAD(P)H azoreductase [Streptomyces acidiscabies]GAV39813.1 NAD(P)H azoreductase [Streptomyces acidiscabies]
MTYVIHGATGAQGAPVVAALSAAGKSAVALTRDASASVPGARIAAVDYTSPSALTDVYRGSEGVFVHLPVVPEADRLVYARNVVDAVREARPGRVVFSTSGFVLGSVGGDGFGSAVALLVEGLADSGVPYAVIEPRLYFENLLLPFVAEAVREEGVLRYPLPAGFRVAWTSHLDIADAAVALFDRTDVTGVVAVGQDPAITGEDIAAAFAARTGRKVVFEPLSPEAFRTAAAPLLGEGPAADVAAGYRAMSTLPHHAIPAERSARKLLGLTPRTAGQWLADIGL